MSELVSWFYLLHGEGQEVGVAEKKIRYGRAQSKIGHFTVMDGSEAGVDLVLIQTFLLYCVNQVILMLTSIFQGQFP